MDIGLSLVLVVFFLAMNAFFVIAEFSLVRVRKSQLELAVEDKRPGAQNAKTIAENVNDYLSACQLGVTLASLALGWLGEPAISALIEPMFVPLGIPSTLVSVIAVAIGYFIMTMLHVVVGELIPKSLAIFSTEDYAIKTARPLMWFYNITYPIMWLFTALTNAVVRLMGHDPAQTEEAYTDEEIMILIDESTESGLIDPEQNEYVDNIFDLSDKDAEAIMTPRIDMVCLDVEDPWSTSFATATQHEYTRYPVCRGDKDTIIGFAHVKDIYMMGPGAHVSDLNIREIPAVPESIPLPKLMPILQANHTKIAVVIDEHGGVSGIVTINDIMEQIVGRIADEYDHDDADEIVACEDGSFLIDGSLPIDELEEFMGFESEEAEECETAAGLLLNAFDRIPDVGETITLAGEERAAHFTVEGKDEHRIDKIRVVLENVGEDTPAQA